MVPKPRLITPLREAAIGSGLGTTMSLWLPLIACRPPPPAFVRLRLAPVTVRFRVRGSRPGFQEV